MEINKDTKRIVLFILFVILLISNIFLYGVLINHYIVHNPSFNWSLDDFQNIFAVIATIIILGFISTRLPQFRDKGDSAIYEIGYLLIIGILSIIVSYFNKSTKSEEFFTPFINVFEVLSILLILLIISTKTKAFHSILDGKRGRKALIYCAVIFSILGCVSSMYQIPIYDSMVTVRELIVKISGLFGGSFVGIPVGVILSGFRFLYGGTTALPAIVSTVLSGVVGSIVFVCNDNKFPKMRDAIILMFLYSGFSMALIILLTPEGVGIKYVNALYPLVTFASVMGVILFRMIIKEEKYDVPLSLEELRINELELALEEYEDKIDKLQEDVELLKKKNN